MFGVAGRILFHSVALCVTAMVGFSCSNPVLRGKTAGNQMAKQLVHNSKSTTENIELHDLRVIKAGQLRSVAFNFSSKPNMLRQFELDTPKRLVIELSGPISKSSSALMAFTPDEPSIREVRIGEFSEKLRLTIELTNSEIQHVVSKAVNKSIITQFRTSAESDPEIDGQILYFAENADFANIEHTMADEDWGSVYPPTGKISFLSNDHVTINSPAKCRLAIASK